VASAKGWSDGAADNEKLSRPELVALVRHTPEEGVLTMCKTGAGGSGPSGPNDNDGYCYDIGTCSDCFSPMPS
jgi:hypothetical protein